MSNGTLFGVSIAFAAILVATTMAFFRRSPKGFLGTTPFSFSSTAEDVTMHMDLQGKTYLVTGCNSGIGLETCRVLALRGATVIGTARTEEKARVALKEFGSKVIPMACDLSKPVSIKKCVEQAKGYRLDGIVANAGIMAIPKLEKIEGYEAMFFTNYLAHFYLVTRLFSSLTDTARVVLVSSVANEYAPKEGIPFDNLDGSKSYKELEAYGTSKLAIVLFAQRMAEVTFKGSEKHAFAIHPGAVSTNLTRRRNPWVTWLRSFLVALILEPYKSIGQGAATQLFALTHPEALKMNTTHYLVNSQEHLVHPAASPEMAQKLWNLAEAIVSKW